MKFTVNIYDVADIAADSLTAIRPFVAMYFQYFSFSLSFLFCTTRFRFLSYWFSSRLFIVHDLSIFPYNFLNHLGGSMVATRFIPALSSSVPCYLS